MMMMMIIIVVVVVMMKMMMIDTVMKFHTVKIIMLLKYLECSEISGNKSEQKI